MSTTLPMRVSNAAFLLDRLGQDCDPLQYIRELTQNSIEAIGRTTEQRGMIVWDVDWVYVEAAGVYKLSIVDNGDGMTGEDQVEYINHLSASISEQRMDGNFGVGAKIAAATRNHEGLLYSSWRDGRGSTVRLWRDPTSNEYGLERREQAPGVYADWFPISDEAKPDLINDHGTVVVLLGNSHEENTALAPSAVKRDPSRWVARYLNRRYFCFPDGIEVRAREFGRADPSEWPTRETASLSEGAQLRTVHGQKYFLDRFSDASGSVPLTGATAHWWLLQDDETSLANQLRQWQARGHVAALFQNELYEMTEGNPGVRLLQQFGSIFGHRRIVIYVEPDRVATVVTSNTARSQLFMDGERLPWTQWSDEFRSKLPEEIRNLEEEILAGKESRNHTEAIRERLRSIQSLFKLSRYRRTPHGHLLTQGFEQGGTPREDDAPKKEGRTNRGGHGGRGENLYGLFFGSEGDPATPVTPTLQPPATTWISLNDNTRNQGDLEDRAARYLKDQHTLLINSDFRVFTDMIDHWVKNYSSVPGIGEIVVENVHEWFEQQLIETVMGVQQLEGSQEWNSEQVERSLSEEALTAAVMARWHVYYQVKRALGTKIGSVSQVAVPA